MYIDLSAYDLYLLLRHKYSEAECWPYPSRARCGGGKGSSSYGAWRDRRPDKYRPAHRVIFEIARGPIPEGLVLDHLCRNKLCVNPAHLEPVTIGENALRGIGACSVNAGKTHCPKGHAYRPATTRLTIRGHRRCLICDRNWKRQYYTENRDRLLKLRRAADLRRIETIRAQRRAHYRRHRDEILAKERDERAFQRRA